MITLGWIVLAMAVVGTLSARYGADSRDGADWQDAPAVDRPAVTPKRRHTVRGDLAALRRAVAHRRGMALQPIRRPSRREGGDPK